MFDELNFYLLEIEDINDYVSYLEVDSNEQIHISNFNEKIDLSDDTLNSQIIYRIPNNLLRNNQGETTYTYDIFYKTSNLKTKEEIFLNHSFAKTSMTFGVVHIFKKNDDNSNKYIMLKHGMIDFVRESSIVRDFGKIAFCGIKGNSIKEFKNIKSSNFINSKLTNTTAYYMPKEKIDLLNEKSDIYTNFNFNIEENVLYNSVNEKKMKVSFSDSIRFRKKTNDLSYTLDTLIKLYEEGEHQSDTNFYKVLTKSRACNKDDSDTLFRELDNKLINEEDLDKLFGFCDNEECVDISQLEIMRPRISPLTDEKLYASIWEDLNGEKEFKDIIHTKKLHLIDDTSKYHLLNDFVYIDNFECRSIPGNYRYFYFQKKWYAIKPEHYESIISKWNEMCTPESNKISYNLDDKVLFEQEYLYNMYICIKDRAIYLDRILWIYGANKRDSFELCDVLKKGVLVHNKNNCKTNELNKLLTQADTSLSWQQYVKNLNGYPLKNIIRAFGEVILSIENYSSLGNLNIDYSHRLFGGHNAKSRKIWTWDNAANKKREWLRCYKNECLIIMKEIYDFIELKNSELLTLEMMDGYLQEFKAEIIDNSTGKVSHPWIESFLTIKEIELGIVSNYRNAHDQRNQIVIPERDNVCFQMKNAILEFMSKQKQDKIKVRFITTEKL